jgi:hypothetical protein
VRAWEKSLYRTVPRDEMLIGDFASDHAVTVREVNTP